MLIALRFKTFFRKHVVYSYVSHTAQITSSLTQRFQLLCNELLFPIEVQPTSSSLALSVVNCTIGMFVHVMVMGLTLAKSLVHCQECRVVSICGDENRPLNNAFVGSGIRQGQRGDIGPPGKAGPIGSVGPRGEKGFKGMKGEPGSTDGIVMFQEQIRDDINGE